MRHRQQGKLRTGKPCRHVVAAGRAQAIGDAIGVVRPDDPSKYEMNLAADGSASFRLYCNRATGSWFSADASRPVGGITFSPLAMTRAFCPESLDTRVAGSRLRRAISPA